MAVATLPVLLPILIREFSLTIGLAGILGFLFRASAAVADPIIAFRSENILNRKVILLSGLIICATMLSLYPVSSNFMVIAVITIFAGAASSVYHPQALTLLKEATQGKMGTIVGFHGLIGGIGIVLSPLILTKLIIEVGWKYAVPLTYGPLIIIACPLLMKYCTNPTKAEKMKFSLSKLGGNEFIYLVTYTGLMSVASLSMMLFLPLYFQEIKGLDLASSGLFYSITNVGMLIGMMIGGPLSDRVDRRLISTFIPFLYSISFAIFTNVDLPQYIWVGLIISCRMFASSVHPMVMSILAERPGSPVATSIGMMEAIVYGLSAIAPPIIGAVADTSGLEFAMGLLVIPSFAAGILSLTMSKKMMIETVK